MTAYDVHNKPLCIGDLVRVRSNYDTNTYRITQIDYDQTATLEIAERNNPNYGVRRIITRCLSRDEPEDLL